MNIQKLGVKKRVNRHNNPLLPQSLRSLVVGRSNCGKTNFLLNLLLRDGFLDYDNLLVFGHSLHQDDYQVIKKGYQKGLSKDQLSNLFQNAEDPLSIIEHYKGELKGGIKAEFYENCDDIPDPNVSTQALCQDENKLPVLLKQSHFEEGLVYTLTLKSKSCNQCL